MHKQTFRVGNEHEWKWSLRRIQKSYLTQFSRRKLFEENENFWLSSERSLVYATVNEKPWKHKPEKLFIQATSPQLGWLLMAFAIIARFPNRQIKQIQV